MIRKFSLWGIGCSFLFSGCVSMSSMQTARTTEKDQFVWGIGASGVNTTIKVGDEELKLKLPLLEYIGRYGITQKLDAGIKIGIIGTSALDVKYQYFGTATSKAASSIGLGLGYVSVSANEAKTKANIYDISVPFYFSLHPKEWVALYTNPKYICRMTLASTNSTSYSHWYGGTGGIRLGKRVAFIMEYTLFASDNSKYILSQITGGVSVGIR